LKEGLHLYNRLAFNSQSSCLNLQVCTTIPDYKEVFNYWFSIVTICWSLQIFYFFMIQLRPGLGCVFLRIYPLQGL
jgi:hypothetical protein